MDLDRLILALQAQTDAITRLAASNEALVQAMLEPDDEEEPEPPRLDLDGNRY